MTPCRCALYQDLDVVEFQSNSPIAMFTILKRRGLPQWWLSLTRCSVCGSNWLKAQEERLNDVYVIKRLTTTEADDIQRNDVWPEALQTYEELLQVGKAHGHAARYGDSMETVSICIDLLGQRPTIQESVVANLLNITAHEATVVLSRARLLLEKHGYPYPWSSAA